LRRDEDVPPDARKLLSFTDNRQDASLQAGHLNDFTQVVLLRGALLRALGQATPERVIRSELRQPVIANAQQAALLEIRLSYAPRTCQVFQQPVFEKIDHRPSGILVSWSAADWLFHEVFGRRIER
jgi:hypothetical protein